MEYEEYVNETVLATKDWVFWYNNQKEKGKNLDTLSEPLYNICMAYVSLAGRYMGKPAWDVDDGKIAVQRLIAKADKLKREEEDND